MRFVCPQCEQIGDEDNFHIIVKNPFEDPKKDHVWYSVICNQCKAYYEMCVYY